MISTLKKFRGRTIAEFRERGRQKFGAFSERCGMSRDLRGLADREFVDLFRDFRGLDPGRFLEAFTTRPSRFHPSLIDRASIVGTFENLFPGEKEAVIDRAEKAALGYFDLLGYEQLFFGGVVPDWHLEPISGKRSPGVHWSSINELDSSMSGDKKIVWELNRHQHFTTLGQAYWLTGDKKFVGVFVDHISDWLANNPPKSGVNWVSSLEIAYRSISWVWAFHFFSRSSRFDSRTMMETSKGLYLNGRHIRRHLSTYSSPNTHLTGEALGLYVIGEFLNGMDEAAEWKRTGYKILMSALTCQVREDGGYVEQATAYHRYTADIYLSLLVLRRTEGLPIDQRHEDKLRKMLHFLLHIARPDGRTPLIGDDDGGRLHFFDGRDYDDFRSTLAVGAAVLQDAELKFGAGAPCPELLWLTGTEGLAGYQKLESTAPSKPSKPFETSGIYVIRDDWEAQANHILIDCGEHGFLNGGHAHADALAFTMSLGGVPVFIDSGTYNYASKPSERDHFRSSQAHNCLTVNGTSSSVTNGPFSWRNTAAAELLEWAVRDGYVLFRGSHDGFRRFGVKYERQILSNRGGALILTDKIETSVQNSFEVQFILSPQVTAEIADKVTVAIRAKDGNRDLLTIDTRLTKNFGIGGWALETTYVSPRYGKLMETSKLIFKLVADSDFEIVNTLMPAGG